MLEFDFEALAALGLTPALASRAVAAHAQAGDQGAARVARVTEVHRETVVCHDGVTERNARMLPRLARSLIDAQTGLAAGDWAIVTVDAFGQHWIAERVPPTSHITRRDAEGGRHPIVSNIDVAVLVMGLDDDFNPRRLERFIAMVHDEAIVPVVVLTKADIVATPQLLDEQVATVRRRLPARVDIVAVDATAPAAAVALQPYLAAGSTLVMLGSSGAGKSTLTNTLLGARVQDTGAVREADGRGKHTTTSRSLHRLPGGACVIDTPGVRTLRPDGDEAALAESFADIEALSAACRFRDCQHGKEPGCAVQAGVDADRLRNYQKMLREVRRDTLTALERQRQVAQFKVRGRAVKVKMKMKRGVA
jgi:ribosome biogenesis GTPase / thiamine phosphate phosphatase